ncbi:MAG: IS630 family transposase [Ktedonobacterales bacterium]
MKPWQHEEWCIPEASAAFVYAMEDVLALYAEEYDPAYPTVCLDETPVSLHAQPRPDQAATPGPDGHVERRDYEYVRAGTANLFVLVEPLAGWRHVAVTARRTKRDYVEQLRYLADEVYPTAEYIRLVQDNLNTHTLAALYDVFPPEEAARLAERFEVHYTPKHGSWLNMAEIEISIVQRGCLARPVADTTTLERRVGALETERNAARCRIRWQFTVDDARTKLHDLYPVHNSKTD